MESKNYEFEFEGSTATWEINLDGPIHGTYLGKFKFRCFLTPSQKITANRDYLQMIGTNPTFIEQDAGFLAFALSQLKQRIIKAPPFWDATGTAGDVSDHNILMAVLDASISAEEAYRAKLTEDKGTNLKNAKKSVEALIEANEGEANE